MYTKSDLSSCPLWAHLSDMLQGAPLQKLPLSCSLSQKSANTSTNELPLSYILWQKNANTFNTTHSVSCGSCDVGKISLPYFWSMSCMKRLPWWKYFLIKWFWKNLQSLDSFGWSSVTYLQYLDHGSLVMCVTWWQQLVTRRPCLWLLDGKINGFLLFCAFIEIAGSRNYISII